MIDIKFRSWVIETLLAPIRWGAYLLIRLGSSTTREQEVVIHGYSDRAEQAVAKVRAAIRTLGVYQPVAVSRLAKHVRAVMVLDAGGPEFQSRLRLCVLPEAFVLDRTAIELASVLSHEAAHARLSAAGFPYEGVLKSRIEEICLASQARFARRIPDSELSRSRVEVNVDTSKPWWGEEQLARRRKAELGSLGMAPWLIGIFDLIRRLARSRDSHDSS